MADGNNDNKTLSVVMEKLDDVPEMYRGLYGEVGGKIVLTGIAGVKTQTDIDRLQQGINTEREAHKKTKERMQPFIAFSEDQIKDAQGWLDRRQEIEAQIEAAGTLNEEKINKLVESRIVTRLAPIERAKGELETKLEEARKTIKALNDEKLKRIIHDAIREQRPDSKYVDTAEEDILMVGERMLEVGEDGKTVTTRQEVGVTPGITVKDWLVEMQPKRKHWWPPSEGGGAPGNRGTNNFANNPWTEPHWNITKQGAIERDDPKLAEQMRKSAGVELGATRPRKK